MKRSTAGRGLFYTRDSGGEHETTPGEYVLWAHQQAVQMKVIFTGTPDRLLAMIHEGLSHEGDLFLDYGVKGNQLQRPGLDALFRIAQADPAVTHIFIPRRDRFARPDDPLDAMRMEGTLRESGLWLVFMDKKLPPLSRGSRDLGEAISTMIDYDRAGQERRDLSQKMIYAQLHLAKAGYSTGGRPPYGFRRWLVRVDGEAVRQLVDRESVKIPGHHVVWLPGPPEELTLIQRILEMLETMPAARVATVLTAEGVPSPNAGRLRTDRGVKHATSGVWRQQSVLNIARNPLLRAVVEYGRRSMGDRLRFSLEGPRELQDTDLDCHHQPKVVTNPEAQRVRAIARFDPLVDPERHERLLKKLNERSGTQRGKPRSTDPTRNPLGGRIFDLSCGWPLYRQPNGKSFRYLCGLYQQSHGAKCGHHHVDGLVATRFLLECVRQRLFAPALRAKLEQKLRVIAESERAQPHNDTKLATKKAALAEVRRKQELVGQNLARAEGPEQYRVVAAVFEQLQKQEKVLGDELVQLEQAAGPLRDLDSEVTAALAGLDRVVALANTATDLGAAGQLFQALNARLFFGFRETQLKKRIVNKVASGVVTFGEMPPPVALYEGPTGRRQVKASALPEGSAELGSNESPGNPGSVPGGEGESLGNVCRGEPLCTFVDEIIGLPLALSVFPEVHDFSGDAVLDLVEAGRYRKGQRVRRDTESTPRGQQ